MVKTKGKFSHLLFYIFNPILAMSAWGIDNRSVFALEILICLLTILCSVTACGYHKSYVAICGFKFFAKTEKKIGNGTLILSIIKLRVDSVVKFYY